MVKIWITFFILVGAFQLNARTPHLVKTLYSTEDVVIADWDVTTVEFGADNTGKKDATVAIQAAIDSCYSHKGGTVWMPAGTYKITRTLEVRNFVTLRGDWRDPDKGSGNGRIEGCLTNGAKVCRVGYNIPDALQWINFFGNYHRFIQ